MGFLFWACPSPSDMISIVPAIEQYWVPNYEQFIHKIEESQRLVENSSSLYEAYLNMSQDSSSISMNASLDPKCLPQPKQDEEE
ncbi:hypothetical protein [Picosynechococcus sp. PCC 11901]|uniref:hypothetical protein n=2 Tax=Picosynechococcus sp. PCC 11901 TaxID=2579791 RepID=UPI0030DACE5E